MFAGDADYYAKTKNDFRLNDDWQETRQYWAKYPVLNKVENTDFLQAVTMLVSLKRKREAAERSRKIGVTAKREDVLKLTLPEYLDWRDPLRDAFIWAADFLADLHIFQAADVPYLKQLVPLAALRVELGADADLHQVRARLVKWYWAGVFGELYGSAIETRFVRDLEMVPAWARDVSAPTPRTVADANFVESRLHSMRTRNSAAYKGIMALIMGNGCIDWMEAKTFGAYQYQQLAVDIHHIFPQDWCKKNEIDSEQRESIVNKTMLSARTNRIIGGVAPSRYLAEVQERTQLSAAEVDEILATHVVSPAAMRGDDFASFFSQRREALCMLVEKAMGKAVPRDVADGRGEEDSTHFESVDEDPNELE